MVLSCIISEIVTHWLKITMLSHTTCSQCSLYGFWVPIRILHKSVFGTVKPEWWVYQTVKKSQNMFTGTWFDTRTNLTDRQMDRQMHDSIGHTMYRYGNYSTIWSRLKDH